MKRQAKNETERKSKVLQAKNFRYNRFLLLRYLLALFFFTNLNWALALYMSKSIWIILPFLLLLACLFAIAEHVALYGNQSDEVRGKLRFNQYYYFLQISCNLFLVLTCLVPGAFKTIFPFVHHTGENRNLLLFILVLGICLTLVVFKRMSSIQRNTDTYFSYMEKYKVLQTESE